MVYKPTPAHAPVPVIAGRLVTHSGQEFVQVGVHNLPVLGVIGGTPAESRALAKTLRDFLGPPTCYDCRQPIAGRCTIAARRSRTTGRECVANVHPDGSCPSAPPR